MPTNNTKEEKLDFYVGALLKKPNLRKVGFPKTKVVKLFTNYLENHPKFDFRNSPVFAVSYKDVKDPDYVEVAAIINLIEKYCTDESLVITTKKNRKAILIGEPAMEIIKHTKIEWENAHCSSAIAKIPCKTPINRKLKCFNGEKISDEMKKIEVPTKTNRGRKAKEMED